MSALLRILCILVIVFCVAQCSLGSREKNSIKVQSGNATGACNDTTDLTVFKTQNSTFHASVQTCAEKCLGGASCSSSCIETTLGLTSACANCFGADVECTASHCAAKCFNPSNPDCTTCSEQYCGQALLSCAGVPQNDIPN